MICPCKDCTKRKIPKTCEKECVEWNEWQCYKQRIKDNSTVNLFTNTTRILLHNRKVEKYKRKH